MVAEAVILYLTDIQQKLVVQERSQNGGTNTFGHRAEYTVQDLVKVIAGGKIPNH